MATNLWSYYQVSICREPDKCADSNIPLQPLPTSPIPIQQSTSCNNLFNLDNVLIKRNFKHYIDCLENDTNIRLIIFENVSTISTKYETLQYLTQLKKQVEIWKYNDLMSNISRHIPIDIITLCVNNHKISLSPKSTNMQWVKWTFFNW